MPSSRTVEKINGKNLNIGICFLFRLVWYRYSLYTTTSDFFSPYHNCGENSENARNCVARPPLQKVLLARLSKDPKRRSVSQIIQRLSLVLVEVLQILSGLFCFVLCPWTTGGYGGKGQQKAKTNIAPILVCTGSLVSFLYGCIHGVYRRRRDDVWLDNASRLDDRR
jgi:hypothetical protein